MDERSDDRADTATAAAAPPLDLPALARRLELGELESLVGLYAADAQIELHAPSGALALDGPIGLREGLERISAAGLTHELRLAAVHFSGSYLVDRCRDPRTRTTLAWGGLIVRRGLVAHHSHWPVWPECRTRMRA
jgi:hypothetical protein